MSTGGVDYRNHAGTGIVKADGFQQGETVIDLLLLDKADRVEKVVKVALAASDTAGGFFSWANPEASSIIVNAVYLNVTTQSSAACTVDIGTTATNGTTLSDNLIDGLSVATSGLYSNTSSAGTNGKPHQLLASGKWVTGSVASGASAGIVGFAYIRYIAV